MAISVTRFRARCLEIIREVERRGEPVDIQRRGRVVARLAPPPARGVEAPKKWERLRGSGRLLAEPGDSVLDAADFQAGD